MNYYEQGQQAARNYQASTDPDDLINCDPAAWQQELYVLAEGRDRMSVLAAQGNERARGQYEYLDGYLSTWD